MIKLYNTMTRQVEELKPITPGEVKLYTCGLTVYSQPHIGNWFGYIYWDILVRTLKANGLKVTRTQNITDVGHLTSDDDAGDDKMEKGAKREGITAWDVANKYIGEANYEAYKLLNLIHPDHLVRATDYIPQQIDFVRGLEEKGFTYVIPSDGVYFDTSKISDYGKLARLDIDGLEPGARVSVEGKKNITDFALWKFSPAGVNRDMQWQSPWSNAGFPGWHLECSVIARETLGDEFDIHTGGIDHIPVHHTNEIAQSQALTGKIPARMWVHNNHITVDGTKISKSLGNIITLNDVLDKGYRIEAFKMMVYEKHYRNQGNFSWNILKSAHGRLSAWRVFAALYRQWPEVDGPDMEYYEYAKAKILEALNNDLNTGAALIAAENLRPEDGETAKMLALINVINDLFGIDLLRITPDVPDLIKEALAERETARQAKDWERSDQLRMALEAQNISLYDTPEKTYWSYTN